MFGVVSILDFGPLPEIVAGEVHTEFVNAHFGCPLAGQGIAYNEVLETDVAVGSYRYIGILVVELVEVVVTREDCVLVGVIFRSPAFAYEGIVLLCIVSDQRSI